MRNYYRTNHYGKREAVPWLLNLWLNFWRMG